ncbi:hypothetical protein D3C77_539070 [compost metagenome]
MVIDLAITNIARPGLREVGHLPKEDRDTHGQGLGHIFGISARQLLPDRIPDQGVDRIQDPAILGQLQDLAELLNVDYVTGVSW